MNELLSSLNCIDLPLSGNRFSWRKKKSGVDNIFRNLIELLLVFLSYLYFLMLI